MNSSRNEALRNWIKQIDDKPGVYAIKSLINGSIYVGSSKHSIRQRLLQNLIDLEASEHDVPLLQEDWSAAGSSQFTWMVQYVATAKDAIEQEIHLIKLARALEDYGSYNRRTTVNCISASLRETERKFARGQRVRKYCPIPTIKPHERIHPVILKTFCQGQLPLVRTKNFDLGIPEVERIELFEKWKTKALCFNPEGMIRCGFDSQPAAV